MAGEVAEAGPGDESRETSGKDRVERQRGDPAHAAAQGLGRGTGEHADDGRADVAADHERENEEAHHRAAGIVVRKRMHGLDRERTPRLLRLL